MTSSMAVLKTEGGERRGLSGRAARKMVLIEGEPFGPIVCRFEAGLDGLRACGPGLWVERLSCHEAVQGSRYM